MLTDSVLDDARRRGDPLADDTVAAVFADGQTAAVASLLGTLMRDRDPAAAGLPPVVADYLRQTAGVVAREPATVAAGERMFGEFGPEILMILCCYSLPSSYAARKGVQVLHRTAYLAKRPNRRLFETAQMIVDVMSPGGLGPRGRGLVTAQKVRLMHAAIRHLIVTDTANPWPSEFGLPINQEDLLGTLMTFSWIVIDGLRTIGLRVSPADEQAYLDAWLAVGTLMGVDPALMPKTVEESAAVTALIEKRQVAPSPQGQQMMAALLGMMENNVPPGFKHVPACMIREFLPPDVATFMGVPRHAIEEQFVHLAQDLARPFEILGSDLRRNAVIRAFALHLLRSMMTFELDGQPARFTLPDSLAEGWQTAPADSEESIWQRLRQRLVGTR